MASDVVNEAFVMNGSNGMNTSVPSGETKTVRHCYFDGNGHKTQGIWVNPNTHRGTLIVEECYFTGWGDNALYAESAPPHGGGGDVIVKDCYFHDNSRGHVRISEGKVLNVHIHNTNNDPISNWVSGGLYNWYTSRGTVDVRGCQVDVSASNTRGAPLALNLPLNCSVCKPKPRSQWNIQDSQVRGPRRDPGGYATFTNVGTNPTINPPAGVPMSPAEARNGTSSATGPTWDGDGSGGGGGGGGGSGTSLSEVINDSGENELTVRPQ